ncbi:MAG: tetratricopeptide repeat protein [Acetobacteraceae bacterium]|nr:tetratricopeptide repeat protein [Acetobacteraceae bacterium]
MIVETAVLVGGLSWVFDKVLEDTVGATGHEFLRDFARGAVRELTGPHERPRNHDVARAVRGAQLDAMEDVLAGFAAANAPRWDLAPDQGTECFLRQASAFCRRERGRLTEKEADPDFAPEATLTATMEGLLSDQPRFTPAGARAAAFGELAEDAVLDELRAALKPVPVPEDFAAYLRAGAGKAHPRFLDLFGAGIAARLKDPEDTRFRDILQTGWLADLKALGFETTEALVRVEATFGGLRAEITEIRQVLREVVDKQTAELRLSNAERTALAVDLANVKAELNGTNALVAGFLETMLGRQMSPDRFAVTLMTMAADLRKADVQIDALRFSRNLTPQLQVMLARAKAARDEGRLDEVAAALADITHAQRQARERLEAHARELNEELRLRREGEAEAAAAEGAFARARLAYREAAAHYRAAATVLAATDEHQAWRYTMEGALALIAQGEEFGDNAALMEVVRLYREEVLPHVLRRDRPLGWAGTQNNLGTALQMLGGRESGTARLEEAVAAYRAALEEWTRERVPLDWAMTQNNLGNALARLGERESGTARLEEAVAAYRDALEERTRERVPLDWATTQNNLGNALARLGEREGSTARLEEAVAAYRAALEERTRKRVPLQWAMTQMNLGATLRALGESGTARLEQAVAAYSAALEIFVEAQADYYINICRRNLDRAQALLAERKS